MDSRQPQETPIFQFSLSDLVIAASLGSVFLAISVPLFQAKSPEMRSALLWILALLFLVCLLSAGYFALKRMEARKQAGQFLLRPRFENSSVESWPMIGLASVLFAFAIVLMMFHGPVLESLLELLKDFPDLFPGGIAIPVVGVVAGLAPLLIGMIYGLVMFKWKVTPRTLEIREHGVIVGISDFVLWNQIRKLEWQSVKLGIVLTIENGNKSPVAFIPHDSADQVKSLFHEHAKAMKSGLDSNG